jgi:hypothetical protein
MVKNVLIIAVVIQKAGKDAGMGKFIEYTV